MLHFLWEDEDFVAVNKPAGLATIPGRGETDSALEQLSRQLRLPCSGLQDPRLRVVHRIDKETSGVLLFARNVDAQRHLSRQFQNNQVAKEYLALVAGRPVETQGEIDAPMALHPTDRRRMAVVKHGGRPARTLWKIEERFRDYALLRVFPKTGKTHQIRVHLKRVGLPLAVDRLYNPPPAGVGVGILLSSFKRGYRSAKNVERPLIERVTLHALALTFQDRTGREQRVEAPASKDFNAVLNMLRKYGR